MTENEQHDSNVAVVSGNERPSATPAGLKPGVPRVEPGSDGHWLTQPQTVRRLWWIFGVILTLTVVAQFFIPIKGKFALEGTFGFAAWFGFFACVAMVLVAKALGWWLKRSQDYYGEDDAAPHARETERD